MNRRLRKTNNLTIPNTADDGKKRKKKSNLNNKSKIIEREKILERKRIAERERLKRIKADPEKLKLLRQKEHEKYLRKKETGKIKTISMMTEKEKSTQREKTREKVRNFRLKKKNEQVSHENSVIYLY